jgi:hypothetical protein
VYVLPFSILAFLENGKLQNENAASPTNIPLDAQTTGMETYNM